MSSAEAPPTFDLFQRFISHVLLECVLLCGNAEHVETAKVQQCGLDGGLRAPSALAYAVCDAVWEKYCKACSD